MVFAALTVLLAAAGLLLPQGRALLLMLAALAAIGTIWAALRLKKERGRRQMLKLTQVSKTFNPGTVNQKTALDRVSLDVERGISSPSSAPTGRAIHPVQRHLRRILCR